MTGDLQVDPAALAGVMRLLGNAGDVVEDGSASAPPPPDAGDCTAAVATVLAHLAEAMGTVVDGTAAAAMELTGTSTVYVESDRYAGDALPVLGTLRPGGDTCH